MKEPDSMATTQAPPDLLAEIGELRRESDELARSTTESVAEHEAGTRADAAAEADRHRLAVEEIDGTKAARISAAHAIREDAVDTAERTREDTRRRLEEQAEEMRIRIRRKFVSNQEAAKSALAEATWLAETVYEANETRPREEFDRLRTDVGTTLAELEELDARMTRETRRYRQPRPRSVELDERARGEATLDPLSVIRESVGIATESAERFRRLRLPRLFRGPILVLPAGFLVGLGLAVAAWGFDTEVETLGWGAAGGFGLFVLVSAVLYFVARREVIAAWRPYDEAAQRIRLAAAAAEDMARGRRTEQEEALLKTRDEELRSAREKFEPIGSIARDKAKSKLAEIERRLPLNLDEADRKCREAIELAESTLAAELESAEAEHVDRHAAETARHEESLATQERESAARWEEIQSRWLSSMARVGEAIQSRTERVRSLFPPFTDPIWRNWSPPAAAPPAVRIGTLRYDRTAVEGGLPTDPRLQVDLPDVLELPAVISLPTRASLLLDVDADHRETGLDVLRSVMTRLLATIPPGKARMSILDPVGLGQNFAGFMHLEDEMPGLIGDRIWTEPRQIEQKLVDLTEHMETVIQKYLRNEFPSIDAYNEAAGEIAEPYRFLVVADFPTNFTEESARRLASIVQSGPRCGVFTLLLRDRRIPPPEKFDFGDIERHAVKVRSVEGRLVFDDEGLEDLPFHPDPGPADDLLIEVAHRIGRAAKEAGRVEVPFETIAPADEDFWTRSCTKDLHVALGRAGATRLQELALGVGTAQHALVAGKTGSGKSTLLHALITNLACWHSPDEVEFHLVDFKKGVEFKTYAAHRLPHARSVAVESDREFGLSVLQGLDEELSARGERFRAEGVQDLAGWRSRRPEEPMPRVLLVIDEFQELFVDDDKVSQDASLLLDRLVRQGRAFGMHVLLGSQTLGGAYSLNRSTMGQMGVRIALACNEQDSMLILSDDNVAARLLSRPGEAIYNDQGGLVEGNSPFQVCWLPDETRDRYLERVSELSRDRGVEPRPCVVFEGNAPAVLADNHLLRSAIEGDPEGRPNAVPLWLGDAVAIKDPTSASLRRFAGSHLALIGQQDEPALAITTAALLASCAAHRVDDMRAIVLDGTTADDPNAGYLDAVAGHLPHRIERPDFRGVSDAILEIGRELASRIEEGRVDGPTILLMVHGLQRFRVLRRAEDDFGFSTDDGPPTPDKVFGEILREGPEHGVHVVLWADTVATFERCVDRQGMRAIDQKAMFQVGATDSSTLIDSPAASTLGPNRGLLYNEERGTIEKFRPWGLPSEAYLVAAGRALAGRSS